MLRLASTSVTRVQLLRDAHIDFIQSEVDFDEERITAPTPKNFVYQATVGKYEAAMRQYGIEEMGLLVADTVVTSQGQILRKAKCVDDARNILMTQSGNVTSIITCMIYHDKHKKIIDISSTDYLFGAFDMEALDVYLASGAWRGKAGACMVEGFCQPYIVEVQGFESCAMGLSVERLLAFM
ncbi:MAG: septum formation inhibitor Maf [Sulfuricurvum sp. PC08-66]|nr:MAG: septum formation inhibitor Maf [Sulfuricurvum sp. PC08-66]